MLVMIHLKSAKEIEIMRGPNKIVAEILLELREAVREGISTAELDRIAEDLTLKKKAKPAFKGYRGFPASVCISVNEQVVHGIPSTKKILKNGDVVKLRVGGPSGVTFDNVAIRLSDKVRLQVHLDTDEGNVADLHCNQEVEIIKD
jgi:methionine aminopeptidase